MMRFVLVTVGILACGKTDKPAPAPAATNGQPAPTGTTDQAPPDDARCTEARDKYLAWEADRVAAALQGIELADHRQPLQAEADKEAALAKQRFVAACLELGPAFDASCFEHPGYDRDRARKDHCQHVYSELQARMLHR